MPQTEHETNNSRRHRDQYDQHSRSAAYASAQSFVDDVAPFDGDVLRRSVLARQIEQFLPRLRNGAVIAIDSQWGTVKLGLAFINAFEQDYTEDPFLPIAAELSALLDSADGRGKKLVKKAAAVAAACLPLGAKAAVSMGSKFVFGGLPTSCRAGVVIGSRWCGRRGRLFRATGGICQSAP